MDKYYIGKSIHCVIFNQIYKTNNNDSNTYKCYYFFGENIKKAI